MMRPMVNRPDYRIAANYMKQCENQIMFSSSPRSKGYISNGKKTSKAKNLTKIHPSLDICREAKSTRKSTV